MRDNTTDDVCGTLVYPGESPAPRELHEIEVEPPYRERYGISLKDHNMVACFDTHEAMIEGVRAGLGWATVPDCVLCRYKNDSTFIKFTVDTDPLWYPVELAWSTGGLLSDNARVFMDFIRHNLPEGYFSKSVEAIMNS